jgi:fructose-1-phosphate kinase PfkB-like protein
VGIAGGDTGRAVIADLESHGVVCRFIQSAHPTRVCITVIERSTRKTTELVQEAAPVTREEAHALYRLILEEAAKSSIIVCSGTIAPGVGDGLYGNIACERGEGRDIIVDAKGRTLEYTLPMGAIVKCNKTELCETMKCELDEAIEGCFFVGAKAVIVSNGSRPTVVSTRGQRWMIPSPKVKLVSPIGSGDAMAAGLAVGLERGMLIQEAAKLGVACAASNAMSTIAGDIDPAVVESLFEHIKVEDA